MSTAGKVLVVFVMPASLVWLILMAGVAQLNYNGNEQLDRLAKDLEKVQTGLQDTRREVVTLRDQITATQEEFDRQMAGLRAQQAELEKTRSQIVETLTRAQYQLTIVNDTIKVAGTSLSQRHEKFQAEEQAMDDLRNDVQKLKSDNGQLAARLQSLRGQFQQNYHSNLEMLSKKR